VALVGYSLGSRAALMAALDDSRVKSVVSISGFADFSEVLISASYFEGMAPLLTGATPESLAVQFGQLGEGVQPYEAVVQLAPRPVLVVHGEGDDVVPSYNADALTVGSHVQKVMVPDANHSFAAHRDELVKVVVDFLNR
jgi:pimeloyl-ACP methyl ester carboxylesterase